METEKLSRTHSIPLKEQIRTIILNNIRTGKLETGDRIPSINEFAKKFKIARDTVRLGLDTLVERGVLIPEHGKGYFVATRESHMVRIGLIGRLDGVYMRPIYEGLKEEMKNKGTIILLDSLNSTITTKILIENLAYHQSVDRLLVVPKRGEEGDLSRSLEPFRRYFKLAWLDRAPAVTKDPVFLCPYSKCIRLGLNHLKEKGVKAPIYFSRNPEDESVFTAMRQAYLQKASDWKFRPRLVKNWEVLKDQVHVALVSGERVGIFTETDEEALYVHSGILRMRLRIPEDVLLVTCDNSDLTEIVQPKITAIDPGFFQLGKMAGQWIKQDLKNAEETKTTVWYTTPKLVVKESS